MAKIYRPNSLSELKALVDDNNVRLGCIDTSLITDMSELFLRSKRKNFDSIELWDTSNVTGMSHMFCNAKYFNHPSDAGTFPTSGTCPICLPERGRSTSR